MKHHELSKFFPMLPKEEFEQLKQSIKEHGLREAIVLLDGMILDGRNRYLACKQLGIQPRFEDYEPGESDALDFVVDMNMRRRHLSPEQKARIIMDIEGVPEPMSKKESGKKGKAKQLGQQPRSSPVKPKSYTDLARKAGVSEPTIKRVAEASDQPDLVEKMREGKISAREAVRERSKRMSEKAKIKPTWQGLYAKAPDAKRITGVLGRVINGVDKWLTNNYGLDKIDPQGHTPLLIKKTTKAIAELERFKTALEDLRNG